MAEYASMNDVMESFEQRRRKGERAMISETRITLTKESVANDMTDRQEMHIVFIGDGLEADREYVIRRITDMMTGADKKDCTE